MAHLSIYAAKSLRSWLDSVALCAGASLQLLVANPRPKIMMAHGYCILSVCCKENMLYRINSIGMM